MLLKKYKYQIINFYKVILLKTKEFNKKDKSINNNILKLINMEVVN